MTCCSMKHELIWHTAIQTTLAEASHSPALLRCGCRPKPQKRVNRLSFAFIQKALSSSTPEITQGAQVKYYNELTDTWWHLKITIASRRVCRQILTAKNETLSGLVVGGVLRQRYTYIARYHPSFYSSVWNSSQLIWKTSGNDVSVIQALMPLYWKHSHRYEWKLPYTE